MGKKKGKKDRKQHPSEEYNQTILIRYTFAFLFSHHSDHDRFMEALNADCADIGAPSKRDPSTLMPNYRWAVKSNCFTLSQAPTFVAGATTPEISIKPTALARDTRGVHSPRSGDAAAASGFTPRQAMQFVRSGITENVLSLDRRKTTLRERHGYTEAPAELSSLEERTKEIVRPKFLADAENAEFFKKIELYFNVYKGNFFTETAPRLFRLSYDEKRRIISQCDEAIHTIQAELTRRITAKKTQLGDKSDADSRLALIQLTQKSTPFFKLCMQTRLELSAYLVLSETIPHDYSESQQFKIILDAYHYANSLGEKFAYITLPALTTRGTPADSAVSDAAAARGAEAPYAHLVSDPDSTALADALLSGLEETPASEPPSSSSTANPGLFSPATLGVTDKKGAAPTVGSKAK